MNERMMMMMMWMLCWCIWWCGEWSECHETGFSGVDVRFPVWFCYSRFLTGMCFRVCFQFIRFLQTSGQNSFSCHTVIKQLTDNFCMLTHKIHQFVIVFSYSLTFKFVQTSQNGSFTVNKRSDVMCLQLTWKVALWSSPEWAETLQWYSCDA